MQDEDAASMQRIEVALVAKLQEAKRAGDADKVAKIEKVLSDLRQMFAEDLCNSKVTN